MNVPLEILEDDGAFVEGAWRSVRVQFESGNETLGGDFEEVFGLLIRIYFVCAIDRVSRESECQRSGSGVSSTILFREASQRLKCVHVNANEVVVVASTYSVRNAKVLERDPYPLHKGTETATEKGDIRIPRMCVDGVEGFTGTLAMILFSRIDGKRHDQGRSSTSGDSEKRHNGCQKVESGNATAATAIYFHLVCPRPM
jgi:hypothetical protein